MSPAASHASLWQNVVAIAIALGAAVWLVRRAVGPKRPEKGPCASCPAHLSTAKRPGRTASAVPIAKK
jgi:hypothetical protein